MEEFVQELVKSAGSREAAKAYLVALLKMVSLMNLVPDVDFKVTPDFTIEPGRMSDNEKTVYYYAYIYLTDLDDDAPKVEPPVTWNVNYPNVVM